MDTLPLVEHGWDVADGYIEWLMPRIHPYLSSATIPHHPIPVLPEPAIQPQPQHELDPFLLVDLPETEIRRQYTLLGIQV